YHGLGCDKPFELRLLVHRVAEHTHTYTRLPQVRRHAHSGDADRPDARVLEIPPDDGHDLFAHLLPDLVRAVAGHDDLRISKHRLAYISSRSSRYVSMVSPARKSSQPSSPIPHSCPAGISRTSSLKCLREVTRPSKTCSLARKSLTQPPRLPLPSTTRDPAMMPRRGILIGVMTSTRPSRI